MTEEREERERPTTTIFFSKRTAFTRERKVSIERTFVASGNAHTNWEREREREQRREEERRGKRGG